MRLIDADDLRERFKERYMAALEWKNKTIFREKAEGEIAAYLECVRTLNAECTIDAVPVVRCKDCVYAKPFNAIWRLPKRNTLICTLNGGAEVAENDFCSFGRINETN